jgi:hypothetical protein
MSGTAGSYHLHSGPSTAYQEATVSHSIPPPEQRHSIAEVLTLVDRLRRLAFDVTLAPGDALRRIRDAFADYDIGS